jgi:glutamyl-tRNA reductase
LNRANIVISSTSSNDYVLNEKDFDNQTNKILLIDIAVPRDISPAVSRHKNVVLKNIDDLHLIVDKNFEKRMSDLPKVKKIIMQEMSEFLTWYYSLPLLPEFQKPKGKPDTVVVEEIKQVKEFLAKNVSLLHKMTRQAGNDADSDLKNHLELVKRLYASAKELRA